jgi:oxygen-independent coproporphyrinogen-3 oxidase
MSAITVDLDLALKYSMPGPRYTSYPPATHFVDQEPDDRWRESLRENNATPRELSLYFHLPFCQTLCWFCGCTTVITLNQGKSAVYLDYLRQEVEMMSRLLHPERSVVQLHFGGGTPTFLLPDEIRSLGGLIQRHFRLAPDVEAAAEIDPRRLTRDHLVALREAGFNRISMGVQDNDPQVQKAVHRLQPRELTEQVVAWSRETGFTSLNIDLIYGLPYQTPKSFESTLDEIVALQPDRLAIFSYAHVPWMKPAQKILKDDILPTPRVKLELLKLTIEKLTACGYVYIGMDHFAREGDELALAQRQKTLQRNFQGYSTRGGADIYAFGMSSISQAGDAYWQNHKDLPLYYGALAAGHFPMQRGYYLTQDDRLRQVTIMRLMCDLSLDYAAMSDRLGIRFEEYFAEVLASLVDLEADGLLQRSARGLEVTNTGRLFIRNIAMRFDAYLKAGQPGRYSKTV